MCVLSLLCTYGTHPSLLMSHLSWRADCFGYATIYLPFVIAVDYSWGAWGDFGTCNGICGGGAGQMGRQRNCIPPQHGGEACPSANDIEIVGCTNDNACGGKFTSESILPAMHD